MYAEALLRDKKEKEEKKAAYRFSKVLHCARTPLKYKGASTDHPPS
jgi:hypothetical protein